MTTPTPNEKKQLGHQVYQNYLHAREDGLVDIKEPFEDESKHSSTPPKHSIKKEKTVSKGVSKTKRDAVLNDAWWDTMIAKEKEFMSQLRSDVDPPQHSSKVSARVAAPSGSGANAEKPHDGKLWNALIAKEEQYLQEVKKAEKKRTREEKRRKDEMNGISHKPSDRYKGLVGYFSKPSKPSKKSKKPTKNSENCKKITRPKQAPTNKSNNANIPAAAGQIFSNGSDCNFTSMILESPSFPATPKTAANKTNISNKSKSSKSSQSSNKPNNGKVSEKRRKSVTFSPETIAREEAKNRVKSSSHAQTSQKLSAASPPVTRPTVAPAFSGVVVERNAPRFVQSSRRSGPKTAARSVRNVRNNAWHGQDAYGSGSQTNATAAASNTCDDVEDDEDDEDDEEQDEEPKESLFKQSLALRSRQAKRASMDKPNPNDVDIRHLDESLLTSGEYGDFSPYGVVPDPVGSRVLWNAAVGTTRNENDFKEMERNQGNQMKPAQNEVNEAKGSKKESKQSKESKDELQGVYAVWNQVSQKFDLEADGSEYAPPDETEVFEMHRKEVKLPPRDGKKSDVRVLFLDVDGVLNHMRSDRQICDMQLGMLRNILERVPTCRIVLSTSWRLYLGMKQKLLQTLRKAGIDVEKRVIGETPDLTVETVKWTGSVGTGATRGEGGISLERRFAGCLRDTCRLRPFEMKAYLENNEVLRTYFNVLEWCAVDDLPLGTFCDEIMKGHFVKTRGTAGMRNEHVEAIVRILSGERTGQGEDEKEVLQTIREVKELAPKVSEMNENVSGKDAVANALEGIDDLMDAMDAMDGGDEKGVDGEAIDSQSEEIEKLLADVAVMEKEFEEFEERQKAKGIRVIFLDVDGVLNYQGFKRLETSNLCQERMQRLKKVLDSVVNARIVLSTSWRIESRWKDSLMFQLKKAWNMSDKEMDELVIGSTPVLSHSHRSHEIKAWIDKNESRFNILSWVAVDDIALDQTGKYMKNHFVRTDFAKGLTQEKADELLRLLNCSA